MAFPPNPIAANKTGSGDTEHPDHHNELATAVNDITTHVEALTADDIDDSGSTNKFVSAAQLSTIEGLGALAAQDEIAVPADITATGTPSASTYLRGDGAWATPSGAGGTPHYVIAASNSSAGEKAVADETVDGTDDDVQIQAALDAGRSVLLCNGLYDIGSPIAMPSKGHIQGVSQFGVVLRANGITTGDRAMFVSKNNSAILWVIENLSMDGNYAVGGPCHGIRMRNTARDSVDPPANGSDNWSHIRNVFLEGFRDATTTYHGIWLESANTTQRSNNIHNVSMFELGGHGLYLDGSSDNVISNVHIGSTRSHGFHIAGANNRFTNCKSFYSDAAGFHITSTRNTLVGIEAQDMSGDGVYVSGAATTISGLLVDANNSGRNCTSGIEIAASYVSVTGATIRIGSGSMDEAIRFTSGSDMLVDAVVNNVAADFDTAHITGSTPVDSVVRVVRPGTTPLVAP